MSETSLFHYILHVQKEGSGSVCKFLVVFVKFSPLHTLKAFNFFFFLGGGGGGGGGGNRKTDSLT